MGKKRFKETNYFRDVRRGKARRGKRVDSENQKGDPRNYIRFERGDVVEWKGEYGQRFCGIQESRGIDNCKLLGKSRRRERLSFAE